MKDVIIVGTLVVAFATFVTVHLYLGVRLALRPEQKWRGLVALLVPPLAPIWAFKEGWRRSAGLWLVSVAAYVLARLAAEA